jgi:hypothetical protein
MKQVKDENKALLQDLPSMVKNCEALRKQNSTTKDISLGEYVQQKYAMSMETYLESIGVDGNVDTIENLFTSTDVDSNYRWLVPEIIRQALRLGLRKPSIWSEMIIGETPVAQTTFKLPWWNMSDATPEYVGEAETIPLGGVSFGQKQMEVRKMGKGIKIPYEVRQYVAVNIVQIFLQDMGVKLNQGLDTLLITMLINGEQADGSESAPVIGVDNTTTGFTYRDMLRLWIRMGRIGRSATKMIGGEKAANDILNLPEFKDRKQGVTDLSLNLKTPVPNTSDFYVHGGVPEDQIIVVDKTATCMKFNDQPLLVETEKIVSNQTEATYATLTTGFAIVYRDGRVIMDADLAYSSNGFPAFMDVDAQENVTIND